MGDDLNDELDLKYFKKRLEQRLEELTRDQQTIAPVELDQARVGRLTRMDAMQQQAISKAAARLVEAEKSRIGIALNRMKTDDYGYCMNCDEDIPEARLRVDPSALTCIACARATEGA